MDDIALIKFDRPLLQNQMFQNSSTRAIFPICLPDSSYNEINKISMDQKIRQAYHSILPQGFVTGLGLERQDTCRTNGKGPEIYSTCAFGSIYTEKDRKTKEEITKIERHKNRNNQWICLSGNPRISLDPQCKAFNYLHNKEVYLLLFFLEFFFFIFYSLKKQMRLFLFQRTDPEHQELALMKSLSSDIQPTRQKLPLVGAAPVIPLQKLTVRKEKDEMNI